MSKNSYLNISFPDWIPSDQCVVLRAGLRQGRYVWAIEGIGAGYRRTLLGALIDLRRAAKTASSDAQVLLLRAD